MLGNFILVFLWILVALPFILGALSERQKQLRADAERAEWTARRKAEVAAFYTSHTGGTP